MVVNIYDSKKIEYFNIYFPLIYKIKKKSMNSIMSTTIGRDNIFYNKDILSIIKSFTNISKFLYVNKKIYQLKKYLYDWILNKKFSLQYYKSFVFKIKLNNLMINPNKQLSLIINDDDELIENMSILSNVYSLNLSFRQKFFNENMYNINGLSNIHTLVLSGEFINNVSALRNVHTLTLYECYNLKDVSPLANVNTLTFHDCANITDINMLCNVKNISLISCCRITDITCLSNVIYIYDCPKIVFYSY